MPAEPSQPATPPSVLHRLLLAAGCALALSACGPGDGQPGGASGSASAAQARNESQWQEFERIERIGRSRPLEFEQRLRPVVEKLPAGSAERLEALSLRGLLAASANERELTEAVEKQLRDWPTGALRASAQVSAAIIMAAYQRNHGDVREARKRMLSIEPEQIKAAGLRERWRYYRLFSVVTGAAGEFDATLAHAQTALRLAQELGRSWRLALSLADLAQATQRADTPARAQQLVAQALVEAQRDPDPMLLNTVYTMRGVLYADEADQSVTLQAYSDALEQATLAGADSVRALNLANFADYHLRQGHPARALELGESALPLAVRTRNVSAASLARTNIGLAKISMGRIAEGREDVRAGITLDEQSGALSDAVDGWGELGRYLERFGDLRGAVEALHEYRRRIEQVLREDNRKTLLEAQERYDAEQRARDIELLNRDNALKSEQLNQRNLALGLWAALGGCVLVSIALLAQAFKRVRRTNEALAISNATLKHQSESDPLTGLANRRHFQAAIKTLARSDGLEASVFLIDVDHFKRINDTWGHATGDTVLVEVAKRLRSAVRDEDLIVRWGGEEFLIVVRTSEPAYARGLAQRLLDLIGDTPVPHGDQAVRVTVSIGFVSLPIAPHGLRLSWERAIDLVDTVMYLAKAHGRNKAYGVERINAQDAVTAAHLSAKLEAAWSEGEVGLLALSGPGSAQFQASGAAPLGVGA